MNITPFPTLSPATIDAINVIGQWLAQDDFSGEVLDLPLYFQTSVIT